MQAQIAHVDDPGEVEDNHVVASHRPQNLAERN
jgi:hypothetical protein